MSAVSDTPANRSVRQLYRVGRRPTQEQVQRILEHSAAAREPLLKVATDIKTLSQDEPECWGPLHALRLLCELPDLSIVPPLLRILPVQLNHESSEAPQLWAAEVLEIIACVGAPVVPLLWEWADDETHSQRSRGAALHALTYVAQNTPESREAIVAEARERLQQEQNPAIAAFLVVILAVLNVAEAYKEVMAAYQAKRVDTTIMPATEARKMMLGGEEKSNPGRAQMFWQRYELYGPDVV